ncbi:MAG: hypothetical protein A2Y38_01895 [Spirochaetes bacterium GWB1_59_5]|nr:MAG: hypothetical protein A2Y38_01895 [Spirochaetes bacterium GWB1_59_5]
MTTIGAPDGSGGGTALHPQVIANSYETLYGKVFNFNHIMRSYDPEQYAKDCTLGTIMSVEFPATPAGGWKVQGSRAAAPGIRGVAAIHKQAENVPDILLSWFSGGRNPWSDTWTVSRELSYNKEESGFLLRGGTVPPGDFAEQTPADFRKLGYVYIPALQAPLELIRCYDDKTCDIIAGYQGNETLFLLSGLAGKVRYYGTGLTPLGKEPEAQVSRMLAAGISICDPEGLIKPGRLLQPLRQTLAMKIC